MKYLDIAYANRSAAEKLDLYLPDEGEGPFRVILLIHGGAFMFGDKAHKRVPLALQAQRRGYAAASINYRLSGEAKFPALIHDAKAAVRWLRAQAAHYRLDPDRIAAWGDSAGGYLVAMLGVSAGIKDLEDLSLGNPEQGCRVQAVVDWYGPTDFLKMDEQLAASGLAPADDQRHNGADSPESRLLGRTITDVPELVRTANPETYVRPDAPPFLLQHGLRDSTVPHQQSVNLAAKLRAVLGESQVALELFPEASHADPAFETADNVSRVLDFLDQYLK